VDSVAKGGRFDGAVGVVAAVEVIRALRERTENRVHPLRVVCFAAQEGDPYGESCIGSKAIAGLLGPTSLAELTDEQGLGVGRAMRAMGLDPARVGESVWSRAEAAAFIELHVEQGRVLEEQAVPVGIVEAVAGTARLLLTVRGRADHSGASMHERRDALTAAAEIILAVESAALDLANQGLRATVGRVDTDPNGFSSISGEVRLGIDVQDADTERLHAMAGSLVTVAKEACDRRGLELEAKVISTTAPAVLPTWLRDIATQACRDIGLDYRVMTSRAARDAQVMNHLTPAGLVLVPSRRGLSHVPEEWTSSLDVARAVRLLVEWITRLDAQLVQWEHLGA
jgi:allantoate deiminase